ncbi:hypothetical protein J1N35_006437 [Gossypium stocksii]|uniref:CCHC-type domain-containing protein n=1 Tax=Gossypium stocksii TaxID=47602 RepID=A0A9D3WGJ1_9ROSI|nr:hypothetical protein J1N35_006437 [Gossypium stocksii]
MVGKVTKLDFNTDSKVRGRHARMAVYVNLGRPLISKILINGSTQRIEYENLPMVYFKCGRYGHIKEHCSISASSSELNGKEEMTEQTSSPSVAVGDEEFGLWMLVERRTRRTNPNGIKKGSFSKGERITGSRFNSLADMEANSAGEDFSKENQKDLNKKGKVNSSDSQVHFAAGKSTGINGSKKGNMGLLIGKAPIAQNQAPKAGASVKAISQAGLMTSRTSVSSLTTTKQADLDKQEEPNNVSIGQQLKSPCLKEVHSNVINFHNSMDNTDPSVGENNQSLASDHMNEGLSNFINNQEQHVVHFNLTFEGSSAINVAVKKGG